MVLSLEGNQKALTAALEIPEAQLAKADGVDFLLNKLDKIYLKDALTIKFDCLEKFECYKRKDTQSIKEYIEEFLVLYNKVKRHHITYSDDLLGYKLLKSANLKPRDEQLVKATITDIKLSEVQTKLSKIYSEGPSQLNQCEDIPIKEESAFQATSSNVRPYDEYHYECTDYDGSLPYEDDDDDDDNELFYTNNRRRFQHNNRNTF